MYLEKTIKSDEVYNGSIIKVEKLEVELPNGKKAFRDIIRHPGASTIVPVDEDNNVYMVRQYRKALEKDLLELPAGKLDSIEEDPIDCAIRELKEETGLISEKIEHLTSIYCSPAFFDEYVHIFLARDLVRGEAEFDEEEFLILERHPLSTLINMVMSGEIIDAKSIIGLMVAEKYIK